jgi:hypothetical protein
MTLGYSIPVAMLGAVIAGMLAGFVIGTVLKKVPRPQKL